jgi:hypothetical protein
MAKQELAVIDDTMKQQLAELAGVSKSGGSDLAVLRVNGRDMDKDGNEYPVGVFALYDGEDTIYGDLTKCKILSQGYQVREWDDANKKYAAETIFFHNGSEANVEDTAGSMRCDKMFSRDVKELDPSADAALITAQKAKKFYRVIWGVASIKGAYQGGSKHKADNVPFIMRLTGNAFMPICDHLEALGEQPYDFLTEWVIEKRAGASRSFYVAIPSKGKEDPMTADELKTLFAIDEDRKAWNDDVMSKWRKKNGFNVTAATQAIEVNAVVIDDAEPVIDDEIPF